MASPHMALPPTPYIYKAPKQIIAPKKIIAGYGNRTDQPFGPPLLHRV